MDKVHNQLVGQKHKKTKGKDLGLKGYRGLIQSNVLQKGMKEVKTKLFRLRKHQQEKDLTLRVLTKKHLLLIRSKSQVLSLIDKRKRKLLMQNRKSVKILLHLN